MFTQHRLSCRNWFRGNAFQEFGYVPVPKGHADNSPTLQRWVAAFRRASPEGTAEKEAFNRPFGTQYQRRRIPNAKALGYCRWSLRDCYTLTAPVGFPKGMGF